MSEYWDPLDPWVREARPHVVLTGGPERIYDDSPKPDKPRPPLGFRITETEPLRWDGDDT